MYSITKCITRTSKALRWIVSKNYCQQLAPVVNGSDPVLLIPNVSRKYTQEDEQEFKNLFPEVAADLLVHVDKYKNDFASKWFEKSMWYNVNGGKLKRGQWTIMAYKLIADDRELTAENLKLVQYVGWMSEMLEGCLFLFDDIIDRSTTRRGAKCYYTLPDVQMQSVHDSIMIENAMFLGLKRYISHKDYYPRIFRMFSETMFYTALGQTLDVKVMRENVLNQTMDRFQNVIKYATCYPVVYMPIGLALEMTGYTDPKMHDDAKRVSTEIGFFGQIRNDYYDCYGDFAETGKDGNDIEENKLSWMAVKAVEKADSRQREIMQNCYGRKDPEKVTRVLALYQEMGIDQEFLQYEKDSYDRINRIIDDLKWDDKIKSMFQTIWNTIYYKKMVLE